jgi:hypothetical protein
MPGVQVEFQDVDWGKEKSKLERGSLQRTARNVRHLKNKAFKKMAAAEMEKLKRFRRFLHSMNNDELQPLLTERLVENFYLDGDRDHQQNLICLQRELASDDILNEVEKRAALTLLKGAFIRVGNFGEADDFLQTLFAMQDLDQLLDSNQELFQGHLEAFYRRGEYDENKGRFLQRDLRAAQLADGNGAALVLELKRVLIDGRVIIVEEEDDNSRGVSSSGSSN